MATDGLACQILRSAPKVPDVCSSAPRCPKEVIKVELSGPETAKVLLISLHATAASKATTNPGSLMNEGVGQRGLAQPSCERRLLVIGDKCLVHFLLWAVCFVATHK